MKRAEPALPRRCRIGATLAAVVSMALVACASPARDAPPTRPPLPSDWTIVESRSGDLRLALPPWLTVFDTTGAVLANEPPAAAGQGFMELMAEGPRSADPRLAPGESVERWIERRLEPAGPGTGIPRPIAVPAGPTLLIERVTRPGTPLAWRFAAYAIQTRVGLAYLLIDGPPDKWAGREEDAALIPMLLEVGPGRPG